MFNRFLTKEKLKKTFKKSPRTRRKTRKNVTANFANTFRKYYSERAQRDSVLFLDWFL